MTVDANSMASKNWSDSMIWSYKLGDFKRRPNFSRMQSVKTACVESTDVQETLQVPKSKFQKPHSNHHGMVYTAYADLSAGALGKYSTLVCKVAQSVIKRRTKTFVCVCVS